MIVSLGQLGVIMPGAKAAGRLDTWLVPLNDAMATYDIDREPRVEMFLATIAEETGELQAQSENLNYSGARLYQLFGGMFASQEAAQFIADQGPEAVANYIYADANRSPGYRLGNTQPGDGWRYRGRGPMQLTGRGNYERFFRAVGKPLNSDPDYLLTPEGGAVSACHFWGANGCNAIADTGDFVALTRRVNGGTFNMPARLHYYALARQAIEGRPAPLGEVPPAADMPRVLVTGCTGDDVLALQHALVAAGVAPGLTEDGVFGEMIGAAVLNFQKREGLPVDGVVGPRTRAALANAAVPAGSSGQVIPFPAPSPAPPVPFPPMPDDLDIPAPPTPLPPHRVPTFWETLTALLRRVLR